MIDLEAMVDVDLIEMRRAICDSFRNEIGSMWSQLCVKIDDGGCTVEEFRDYVRICLEAKDVGLEVIERVLAERRRA